ncbi:GRL1A polymerase, partial [Rhinopomastus cyanomelas]|nr:GRL1A polymerase [Rhinopomastus cyanomelas]
LMLIYFRKFIARLPDKGKKISDFAEKLTLAISQEEELARMAELLSAVRLEFQVKQEKINMSKQQIVICKDAPNQKESSFFNENSNLKEVSEISSQRQEVECNEQGATNTALENQKTWKSDKVTKDWELLCEVVPESAKNSHLKSDPKVSQSSTEGDARNAGAQDSSKDALVD